MDLLKKTSVFIILQQVCLRLAALFAALSFVSKGAIGMGDALLYSCIVCFVGMEKAFYIIFMSVMFAFFAALYLVIVKRKEKKYEIPLVPFIFMAYVSSFMV